jgi:hypothetical protein
MPMDRRVPAWSPLGWIVIGAAGSVDPVNRAADGFLCPVAALHNVRTGAAQAHLLTWA